ncbi:MAG: hypothetical protein WDZ40_02815 [Candidatus Spechtbacterales bacterium]
MQFKSLKFKLKKEDIERVEKTLPVFLAKHFTVIFLFGAVLALLIGSYYFYQNVYVLTGEDYSVFVSVKKVNMSVFEDVLSFIENRRTGSVNSSVPDPF